MLILFILPLTLPASTSALRTCLYKQTHISRVGFFFPRRSLNSTDECQLKLKVVYTNYNSISWSSAFYVQNHPPSRELLLPPAKPPNRANIRSLAPRDISKLIYKLFFIAFCSTVRFVRIKNVHISAHERCLRARRVSVVRRMCVHNYGFVGLWV